jgi:uncharacterized protein YndB with AHSA1/START domain
MAITQLPSGLETLLIEVDFFSISPLTVFSYWIEPTLLQQWWPQQVELQPHVGGFYHLSWPQMNWHLRGHYIAFEPPGRLAFTWRWDHDPQEVATREVWLTFQQLTTRDTRLLLTHGPYKNTPEDQEIRIEHHLTGWSHFLPRLENLLGARTKGRPYDQPENI